MTPDQRPENEAEREQIRLLHQWLERRWPVKRYNIRGLLVSVAGRPRPPQLTTFVEDRANLQRKVS